MVLPFKRPLILLGMVVLINVLLAACQPTPTLAPQSEPGISVGITGDICPNVIVRVGGQVTWTNQDSREHIVRHRPSEGNSQFDSGTLSSGDSFAFDFMQTGSYPYECSIDGAMTGTVTVQP